MSWEKTAAARVGRIRNRRPFSSSSCAADHTHHDHKGTATIDRSKDGLWISSRSHASQHADHVESSLRVETWHASVSVRRRLICHGQRIGLYHAVEVVGLRK